MKIVVKGLKVNFDFEMEGLDINITPEEIKELKTRTVKHVTEKVTEAVDQAVDQATKKVAKPRVKKTKPESLDPTPKKAPAPKKQLDQEDEDPWI